MDNFFHRHAYLIEHTDASVPRALMNEIDWRGFLLHGAETEEQHCV